MMLPLYTLLLAAAVQIEARATGRNAVVVDASKVATNSYDYIIAGGGLAGLTIADRLTENPKVKVLVVEAGPFDSKEDGVLVPGDYNPSPYFWYNTFSAPVAGLLNQAFLVIMGKVVGGGSTINAMFLHRPAAEEMDSWVALGAKGWSYKELLPYWKKSETFSPPNAAYAAQHNISYQDSVHGTSGPIYSSYAEYDYPGGANFWTAALSLGMKKAADINNGNAVGIFNFLRALDPTKGTRSYARTGHYDRVIASRPNYNILPSTLVNRVLFKGKRAIGVEIVDPTTLVKTNATASREVIVTAGGVHSPQILQLSGIGPKALLQSFGIPVIVDLPGVGQNFQDQSTLAVNYNFTNPIMPTADSLTNNATYRAEQEAIYNATRKGAFTLCATTANQAVALALQNATKDYAAIIAAAKAKKPSDIYPNGTDPTVLAGYAAQRQQQYAQLASPGSPVASVSWNTGSQTMIYSLRPLSRGTINIISTDVTAPVAVDFRTHSDDTDLKITLAVFKKNREIMGQPSIKVLGPTELGPANGAKDDATLDTALRGSINPSNAHQCCTTPMMKLEYGGVLANDLTVYGTTGLSVAGVSTFPLTPGSAPSSTTYAASEKAADLIKSRNGT